jgi:hypothetical protein
MNGETDTTITVRADDFKGNTILGVGIRAWITLLLVFTVCVLQGFILWQVRNDPDADFRISEPLYSLVLIAVGYYFGQKNPQTKT